MAKRFVPPLLCSLFLHVLLFFCLPKLPPSEPLSSEPLMIVTLVKTTKPGQGSERAEDRSIGAGSQPSKKIEDAHLSSMQTLSPTFLSAPQQQISKIGNKKEQQAPQATALRNLEKSTKEKEEEERTITTTTVAHTLSGSDTKGDMNDDAKKEAERTSAGTVEGHGKGEEISADQGLGKKGGVGSGHGELPSVFELSSVTIKKRVHPQYPLISRRKGEEGTVTLLAHVHKGDLITVRIEKSSSYSRLDQAALTAIKQWLFTEDLTGTVRVPVIFSLKD
jgi:protein TonB